MDSSAERETFASRSPRHRSRDDAFEGSRAVLELLGRHSLTVAPHVAARLGLALAGDADAIIEVVQRLSESQRHGRAALPDPLPLVGAVAAAVGLRPSALTNEAREVLLTAAVCVEDRTDAVLAATGRSMSELIDSEVSSTLLFVAGRFAFSDPRMRIWIHGVATLAERTAVHAALSRAYHDLGDDALATWHRSLSDLEGDLNQINGLLGIATSADAAGEAEWAHTVAREAASYAGGSTLDRARLIAGRAALHAGLVDDAVDWLSEVLESADLGVQAEALSPYVHAVCLQTGSVPVDMIHAWVAELAPTARAPGGQAVAQALVRAGASAACLLVSIGADDSATGVVRRVERMAREFEVSASSTLEDVRRWCRAMRGARVDASVAETAQGRSELRILSDAVATAASGNPSEGLRALATTRVIPPRRPIVSTHAGHGFLGCASPLGRAYRAVIAAMLESRTGHIDRAARGLAQAAADLPVSLPFGGSGVALARRLDLIASGEIGPIAQALEATHPCGAPVAQCEELGDRALQALLDGRISEAATLLDLAHDSAHPCGARALQPPQLSELRDASTYEFEGADRGATESSYERGRRELALGQFAIADSRAADARRHLLAADELFRSSGALSWTQIVARELTAIPAERSTTGAIEAIRLDHGDARTPRARESVVEVRAQQSTDPLAACRRQWADVLTGRELEVALLVAEGSSNRTAAAQLYVSVRTVEVHLARVFQKVGVRSRVELAVLAYRLSSDARAR